MAKNLVWQVSRITLCYELLLKLAAGSSGSMSEWSGKSNDILLVLRGHKYTA